MFSKFKLGTKIALGFGIILVIALALGGIASYNMLNVSGKSEMLTDEYVPEVNLASRAERYARQTMYSMRGYGLSENENYLTEAETAINNLEVTLSEAHTLADNSENLEKLKGQLSTIDTSLATYKGLVQQTESTIDNLDKARSDMDTAAKSFVASCNVYIEGQTQKMSNAINSGASMTALQQRLDKITYMNNILDRGNEVMKASSLSQAVRDPQVIEDVMFHFSEIDDTIAIIRAMTTQDVDIAELDNLGEAAAAYQAGMQELLTQWTTLQQLGSQRDTAGNEFLTAVVAVADAGISRAEEIATDASSSLSAATVMIIIGLIVALVVGIAMAYIIIRSITKPVNRIVTDLTNSAEQVASASDQVSSSSQELAEGSAEQAASIEQTSSTLEESNAMVQQNAENTRQAALLSKQAMDAAQQGDLEMREMMQTMANIKNSSDEISKIIKVIDDIAFQTNILALNAAVEAARAGEAGMGFAVVAEEVRNLAQRSAQAAKDTATIIEGNIEESNNGVEAASRVQKSLANIDEQTQKVSELINEITAASQEQAEGIKEISIGMTQMEQVVQENAATSEESASAAEELSAQAESLADIVQELSQLVNGANTRNNTISSPPKIRSNKKRLLLNRGSKKTVRVKPEDVIPLDDSDGF